jgi:predicted nucleic acid-binding protein
LELIQELVRNVRGKPWLVHRINEQLLDELVESLYAGAFILPAFDGILQRVVRDPGDDYLMAAAIEHSVDYLVTGDKDLLALLQ